MKQAVIKELEIILAILIFIYPLCFQAYALSEPVDVKNYNIISTDDFPGLKNKVSLDIRSMDILDFLKFLAIEGELNIVASKEISGVVNLLINDVTVGDALYIVLSLNKLAFEVKTNIIKAMTNDEYKELYGVGFYDKRNTVVDHLKYASPANVAAMLGDVKSDIGKVIVDESTGTLVLIDTPDKIREMQAIIDKEELPTVTRVLPTETKVFKLSYNKVDDIKAEITNALTQNIGTIRVDTRSNTMVVSDLPHKIKEIEVIVQAFDKKVKQVFIEAKIVEATLTDTFKWGIQWDRLFNITGKEYSIAPQLSLPLGLTGTFAKVTVDTINTNNLDIVLEMLSTVTETRILSNPHLTVEDGKEAKIEVVEHQPYQEQTTTTASGGTTTTSNTFQWVDVGVSLNVTPTIYEDGNVSILIKPEVSSISTWYGGAAQAAGAVPVVKSANAETTVTIKDGVTIVIAGLIKDTKTKTVNKIPFLGDVPIFGGLFKSSDDDIRRTETIVFLTPRLVNGDEPFLLNRDMPKPAKGVRE